MIGNVKQWLGFESVTMSAEQELAYQKFYAENYERYRRAVLMLSLLLIGLIGVFDFYVYPESSWKALMSIRYGYGFPVVCLLCWFALSKHFLHYQQQHVTLCCVFFASVLAAMLLVAPLDVIRMYQPGFMIVAFFAGAMGALVFRRAVFVAVYVTLAANLLMLLRPQPLTWFLSFNFFYISVVVMALAANYYINLATRRNFINNKALEENNIALEKMNVVLAEQASTDPLTGLSNRRELEVVFERELRRAIRNHSAISLLMVDVDHFKKYNDHFGHQRGDRCLITLAKMMERVFGRAADVVARYGGEEFSILLPDTDNAAALALSQSLQDTLAQQAIEAAPASDQSGKVTVSIGLMSILPTQESDSEALIQLADYALYQAKRKGRNCLFNINDSGVEGAPAEV